MVQRLTYRKRHSYATKSNQHRIVKTPGCYLFPLPLPFLMYTYIIFDDLGFVSINKLGGKLVYQTTKKRASGPKCPVTGKRIQGVYASSSKYLSLFSLFSSLIMRLFRIAVMLIIPQLHCDSSTAHNEQQNEQMKVQFNC